MSTFDALRPARETPRLRLPIPGDASPADYVTDTGAICDRLDVVTRPALVTALPSSPADGDEVYFAADAEEGVLWHLRHHADSGRWQFVGGSPLSSYRNSDTGGPAAPDWGPFPSSPVLRPPLAGVYEIRGGCQATRSSTVAFIWAIAIRLQAPSDARYPTTATLAGLTSNSAVSGSLATACREAVGTEHEIQLVFQTVGSQPTWNWQYLTATPVVVG